MNIANNMVLSTLYVIISGIKNNKRLSHGIRLSPDYQPGLLLLCSHSPNDVFRQTLAERIHSHGTGRRASVEQPELIMDEA